MDGGVEEKGGQKVNVRQVYEAGVAVQPCHVAEVVDGKVFLKGGGGGWKMGGKKVKIKRVMDEDWGKWMKIGGNG